MRGNMKIEKDLTIQVFSITISIILMIIFYILLTTGLMLGTESFMSQNIITPLMLIIIAIICLAIFSTLSKIESKMPKRR